MAYFLTMFIMLHAQAKVNPGVEFDLRGFFDQKISAGETNITIQPGRCR